MARIDDSHQPYKRKRSEGPGPRRRPRVFEQKDWECSKGKNTKTHYVQVCKYVGDGPDRAPRRIKLKKKYKKGYNKEYRAWLKKHGAHRQKPVASYHCRRSRRTGVSCK